MTSDLLCIFSVSILKHEPFQLGERLYTSESDVCVDVKILRYEDCGRQILTYKGGTSTDRIKILLKTFYTKIFQRFKGSDLILLISALTFKC